MLLFVGKYSMRLDECVAPESRILAGCYISRQNHLANGRAIEDLAPLGVLVLLLLIDVITVKIGWLVVSQKQ